MVSAEKFLKYNYIIITMTSVICVSGCDMLGMCRASLVLLAIIQACSFGAILSACSVKLKFCMCGFRQVPGHRRYRGTVTG